MSDCCRSSGYEEFFDEREATRDLARYDKGGLDKMAASMVSYLATHDIEDTTVLEVGGGIGALQIELLKAGAGSSTNVDISGGYERVASRLFAREQLTDCTARFVADFTQDPHQYETADAVVMNRVVCCYPDMEKLMAAALSRSKRFVATSFPRDRFLARIAIKFANVYCAVRRIDFRVFVHDPDAMADVASAHGFVPVYSNRGFIWQAVVFEAA